MALKVAVLGAGGTMGLPMARHVARAGMELRAWNRSREKLQPLRADAALLADQPAEAIAGADVVVTMLSDADAVLAVVGEGALSGAAPGAVWLQASTVGLAGVRRCADLAAGLSLDFVDAPVLGTRKPAEDAQLVVLAAGPPRLRERVRPVFDAIGRRTLWVGPQAGAASALKIAINSWVVTVVEGGAEMVALAQGLGVDPRAVLDALQGGTLDLPYLRMKADAMLEGRFEPSFRLALAAKDARLVTEAAREAGLQLPLFEAVAARLGAGVRAGHGDLDMAATYLSSAP